MKVIGALILVLLISACHNNKVDWDALARCESMGGHFSWSDTALCYVDGEVV